MKQLLIKYIEWIDDLRQLLIIHIYMTKSMELIDEANQHLIQYIGIDNSGFDIDVFTK